MGPMTGIQFPAGVMMGLFLFATASRQAQGPTQPPSQWVPALFPCGYCGQVVKLIAHLHLVPRSRMHGAIPPLRHYVFMAWCSV